MDFTFTEEQQTISKLAADIFERRATRARLTELEAGENRYDAALWKELAGVDSLYTRALIGLCAIQVGVSDRALRMAAEYTTGREQFGRPIGSFQAVQQRMADGFIDLEAIRWTTWHAAWLIAQGRPADRAARVAKFWAADAGARIAAIAQHVHGGIGIDTTYPLHRYFLMSKHNELTSGSATQQLVHLGSTYPEGRL
jgi:alkylation response protein AidB-like acyl-CoA dehydrogenase